MRQNIGYFDTQDTGELNARMFEDVKKIQSGIADKVGMCIQSAFQFIGGLVVAMVFGWKLGLVCLATLPILALAGYIFMVASSDSSKEELDNYAEAGGIAEEVLGSINQLVKDKFQGAVRELQARKAQQQEIINQ